MYRGFIVTYNYKFLFFNLRRIKFYHYWFYFSYDDFVKLYTNKRVSNIKCYIYTRYTQYDVIKEYVKKFNKERN